MGLDYLSVADGDVFLEMFSNGGVREINITENHLQKLIV